MTPDVCGLVHIRGSDNRCVSDPAWKIGHRKSATGDDSYRDLGGRGDNSHVSRDTLSRVRVCQRERAADQMPQQHPHHRIGLLLVLG